MQMPHDRMRTLLNRGIGLCIVGLFFIVFVMADRPQHSLFQFDRADILSAITAALFAAIIWTLHQATQEKKFPSENPSDG